MPHHAHSVSILSLVHKLWPPALLFVVALLAYMGALDNGFVWDSIKYVPGNPHIQQLNSESILWAFTSTYFLNWHPITHLSYMLDYQLYGGYVPAGFHLTNILLHALNVVIFYWLVSRLLLLHDQRQQENRELGRRVAALAAALIFAIHPQHVESVAWVAERKDLLFLLFYLGAMLAYLRYAARPGWRWYLFTLLLAFLSMGSKAMAVTLPAVLLLLDLYPLRRVPALNLAKPGESLKQYALLLAEKGPFGLLALFVIWVTIQAQDVTLNTFELDVVDRLGGAAFAYFSYLSKMFAPTLFLPLYPRDVSLGFMDYAPYFIAFIAMTFLSWYGWRKGSPWWLVAWLFYVVTLLPVSGLVQVGDQVAADRYAYLPLLAAYLVLGGWFGQLFANGSRRRRVILVLVFLMITGGLLAKTRTQVAIWRNDLVLWSHVEEIYPDNRFVISQIAGMSYVLKEWGLALKYYETMLDNRQLRGHLMPRYALLLIYEGEYKQALKAYHWMARIQGETLIPADCIYYNIAWIHGVQGNPDQYAEAMGRIESPEYLGILPAGLPDGNPIPASEMPYLCIRDPYADSLRDAHDKNVLKAR